MIWIAILGMLLATTTPDGDPGVCRRIEAQLSSEDSQVFSDALQAMLDHNCQELFPKVAELFEKRKAPDRYEAAAALALTGRPEYGPLLLTAYYNASRTNDEDPGSLKDVVLLACSNLPREKRMSGHVFYVASAPPPTLHDDCVERYRTLLDQYSYYRTALAALDLLERTASANALNIIRKYLGSELGHVRAEAVIALQNLELAKTLPLLAKSVNDPDAAVRYQSYRILCRFRDLEVVRIMRERIPVETDGPSKLILKKYLEEEAEG